MSNTLSIAAVTETLSRFLGRALEAQGGGSPPGVRVTHLAPHDPTLDDGALVNVYLFRVAPSPRLRNMDQPARGPHGQAPARAGLSLDLTYLITFHGDDARLEPQIMLGAVLAAINDAPVLSPALIAQVIDQTSWLTGCDLGRTGQSVRLSLSPLTDTKAPDGAWTNAAGSHHRLSVQLEASPVILESPGNDLES